MSNDPKETDYMKEFIEIYYKQCNHKCDNCPFSSECTHYESDISGIILKEVKLMFGKIFKATLIVIIALAILGAMWNIPLLGTAIKLIISAALIAWIAYTIYSFKG